MAATASPSPAPRPAAARWRPPVAIVAVTLGLVVSQAVALGILAATGGERSPAEVNELAAVAASIVLVAIIVVFASRGTERLGAATLGIRRTDFWGALGWSLAIAFGVSGAEGIYSLLVAAPEASGAGSDALPGTAAILLALVGVAVAVPIAEEIAFRGYLFPALTRWRGPWPAAVITALLFGAAHALVYPVEVLPMLTFFGFGACLLYWITGSLLPCVGLHALNNAVVLAIVGDLDGWAPLAILGAPLVAIALLLPFARTRAPRRT